MTPFVLRRRHRWRATVVGAAFVAFAVLVVRADTVFVVVACGILGYLAAQALVSRLVLEGDGTLVSRGLLPGRTQAVDLAALQRVECEEVAYTRFSRMGPDGGSRSRRVIRHELRLTDDHGRALTLEPSQWEPPDAVIAAVASAAHAQAVDVVGGELFGIGDAPAGAHDTAEGERTGGAQRDTPDVRQTAGAAPAPPGTRPLTEPTLGGPIRIDGTVCLRLGYRLFPAGLLGAGAIAAPLGRALVGVATGTQAWLVVVLVAAAIAAGVLAWTATFLRTDAAGRLEVRSWPPFVTRSVRLDRIVSIEAHASTQLVSTLSSRLRRNTIVDIEDDRGSAVRLLLDAWQDRDWILEVLADWTRRRDIGVDGPTRRLLIDGEPPQPAPRP